MVFVRLEATEVHNLTIKPFAVPLHVFCLIQWAKRPSSLMIRRRSVTDLAITASSQVLRFLVFFYPLKSIQVWVLSDETKFKITAATKIILYLTVVLLNMLVDEQ